MMKYFTIGEFTKSATAEAKGINNKIPTIDIATNIIELVKNVLDPLREAYGKPIIVSSGYRCEALNKAVGGVDDGKKVSQHTKGEAADIVGSPSTPAENRKLYNLVLSLNLPFDQLIDENEMAWVHISYVRNGTNRRQVIKL